MSLQNPQDDDRDQREPMAPIERPRADLQPWTVASYIGGFIVVASMLYIFAFEGITTTTEYNLGTGDSESSSNLGDQVTRFILFAIPGLILLGLGRFLRQQKVTWPASIEQSLVQLGLARSTRP